MTASTSHVTIVVSADSLRTVASTSHVTVVVSADSLRTVEHLLTNTPEKEALYCSGHILGFRECP